jgi:hypothetical protein
VTTVVAVRESDGSWVVGADRRITMGDVVSLDPFTGSTFDLEATVVT